jgi:hypothetical protein
VVYVDYGPTVLAYARTLLTSREAGATEYIHADLRDPRHQQPTYRSREQVARFFEGTDLVAPGLLRVGEWRPDPGMREMGKSSWWGASAEVPCRRREWFGPGGGWAKWS